MLPIPNTDDRRFAEAVWESAGPGAGLGESLILAARAVGRQRSQATGVGRRIAIEAEVGRVERVTEQVYGVNGCVDTFAAGGDTLPDGAIAMAGTMGREDGYNGWINVAEVDDEVRRVGYTLDRAADHAAGGGFDVLDAGAIGAALRGYWTGAVRGAARRALDSTDPSRRRTAEAAAAASSDRVGVLKEAAESAAAGWLASPPRSLDDALPLLLAFVEFAAAEEVASGRAREAVERAQDQVRETPAQRQGLKR